MGVSAMSVTQEKLKVLIIDDSVVFRLSFYKVLQTFPEIGEVVIASGGKAGIGRVASMQPDLVFCDIEMPVQDGDGLFTLQHLKKTYPDVGVVMVSSMNPELARKTIHSLFLGAVDFIPKPGGEDVRSNEQELRRKVRPLVTLFSTKKYTSAAITMSSANLRIPTPGDAGPAASRIEAVCIGGATGGPRSLMKIIPELPADLDVPVFVVQHMQNMFTSSLTDYLKDMSALPVCEVDDGAMVSSGCVYVAPGGQNMLLEASGSGKGYQLHLTSEDKGFCLHRPSIDMFLHSVADVFDGPVMSIVLTGMGRDGLKGVQALKRKSCLSLVQDEDTSVHFSMPGSVLNAGYADEILPDTMMAERIIQAACRPGS